ncbi:hypothetical protein ACEQPO_06520 [Bacillus sp. SL00103]
MKLTNFLINFFKNMKGITKHQQRHRDKHYEHTLEWAQSLTEVNIEEEWRSAIADGKWSIAEIIAHFVP